MKHDLYIFGSAVRGEVSPSSDIDVLAIPFDGSQKEYPKNWSVYSPEIICSYFQEGRLFAWHLHLEAKCIHSSESIPYLSMLGAPAPYSSINKDIDDLEGMLKNCLFEIQNHTNSLIYELGIAYTAIRDIAMSASWTLMDKPCFSRDAPYRLPNPCPLPFEAYKGAMLARHSSTRGYDYDIKFEDIGKALLTSQIIPWVANIRKNI